MQVGGITAEHEVESETDWEQKQDKNESAPKNDLPVSASATNIEYKAGDHHRSVFDNISQWKQFTKKGREDVALKGPPAQPVSFPKDSKGRIFPTSVFLKTMPHGESVTRDWLVWSKTTRSLYFFSCCLFNEVPPSAARSLFSHP